MSTIPDLTNTSSWPDEDLIALYWACLAEQERCLTLATAAAIHTGGVYEAPVIEQTPDDGGDDG